MFRSFFTNAHVSDVDQASLKEEIYFIENSHVPGLPAVQLFIICKLKQDWIAVKLLFKNEDSLEKLNISIIQSIGEVD